jgi:plastocyanin
VRRLAVALGLLALAGLPACGGSSSTSGGATRTILADYNYDQFPTSYAAYFPRFTPVHPGDTIVFKQAWTGDAHTVTFGTLVKPIDDIVRPYFKGEKQPTDGEPPGLEQAAQAIPLLFGEKDANQTAAQPCYLERGTLPADDKPCPRVAQPAFSGREAFYSSGFIPYEGNDGNTFRMKLSSSIAPGDYFYYCLLHGPGMGGYLTVKPKSAAVPSQSALNKTARRELDAMTKGLAKVRRDALDKKWDVPPGTPKIDIMAGAFLEDGLGFGTVNEFFPKTFTAKVGEKVTWFIFGHTVSFKVPKYGPQLEVDDKTHFVHLNPEAYNPVGVEIPPTEPDSEEPPPPIDAGSYDGSKFLSSGPQFGLAFSITFTKPGTYQYACTIHPRQVGTLVVKA